MGCRQEVLNDFLLDEKASGQWMYQKTGKKSGVVNGELIVQGRDFKEIPCPDLCFDLIQVNGFPLEPFFCSRLFTELSRLLHPQGKLCFNLTPQAQSACRPKLGCLTRIAYKSKIGYQPNITHMATHQPDGVKAEETIIYYGMKSGFTFTKKEFSPDKRRRFAKKQCYTLYLTLTDPATSLAPTPVSVKAKKSSPTLLWFIKAPNATNSEEESASES